MATNQKIIPLLVQLQLTKKLISSIQTIPLLIPPKPKMLDDIDQYIVDQTTRKPKRIWAEGTEYLRKHIILKLALKAELPKFFTCWAVQQRRGYAYYKERLFTIPSWAFNLQRADVKDYAERKEYLLWYVSHE